MTTPKPPDDVEVLERRLRLRLRAITIGVVLVLLTFRVMILPLISAITGNPVDDNGITLGTLVGALLLLLGIEVPSIISNIRGNGNDK
jgi:hypothetical protein